MLIPNHPDDDRLSALAARDDDAVADAALASHVADCASCTETLNELGALRASLAELPDLAPSRPLRLLPPAEEPASAPAAGGIGTWVRRLFAPAMTAGVALAMVGLVGTAGPVLQGMASGGAQSIPGADMEAAGEEPAESLAQVRASNGEDGSAGGEPAAAPGGAGSDPETEGEAAEQTPDLYAAPSPGGSLGRSYDQFANDDDGDSREAASVPAERSIWPMLLFTGVALMVAAALLRWILVARAG